MLCIVRLAERMEALMSVSGDGATRDGDGNSKTSISIRVETITFILESWPSGFQANTPKEVMYIHEV